MTPEFPKIEKEILKFWKDNKIFEKTLKKTENCPRLIFFDGPITVNARPGVHMTLARIYKDVIPRFKTMQGFYVKRKNGWDTHGLPVEIEVEKNLGFKTKKDIERIGIEKFNKECRKNVQKYLPLFRDITERIAYWVDMDDPYTTYDKEYMETLWWIIKQIWDKRLLYQDFKVVPYCPRCGTTLSSHEVAQGYKKIKEPSLYLKLPVKGEKNTYLLVWTTTPWTLPGNVAVAVNPGFSYVKVKVAEEFLILAKGRLNVLDKEYKIVEEFKGKELLGMEYQPLFDFAKPEKKAYSVIAGDFVSRDEGTGLVHMAPAFGEDDMQIGKKNNLSVIVNVDEEGKFTKEVKPWAGQSVTDEKLNKEIITELQKKKLLFREELYEHDYPFCWRCNSKLIYYAKKSWFIKMTALREKLLTNNKKINWVPSHLKQGRFGEWLREVKDWAFSRERYWGTPLPIWQCQECDYQRCLGSIKEIEELQTANDKIEDLHRPYIDKVILKCEKCGGKMKRVSQVIDVWFDSGAMPFSQYHYPFENSDLIDEKIQYPADYIAEAIDQTRGWFYTLLAIATLLCKGTPYKNVLCLGHVLDARGEKMSKSKGNIVDPWEITDKYGADALRWYFYTLNQPGDSKLFSEKDLNNVLKRFIMTFWNSHLFFQTYLTKKFDYHDKSEDILDKWILSCFNRLISEVTRGLEKYDITGVTRKIENFVVENLSLWHIRRSRKRFQKPASEKELRESTATLGFILLNLSKLTAPFIPFLSEKIYQDLTKKESVHLADWPKANEKLIDDELENAMVEVREIVAKALAERAKARKKIKQPLSSLSSSSSTSSSYSSSSLSSSKSKRELLELIKEEINVKKITHKIGKTETKLDTKITPELKEEGQVREIIRHLQALRKKAGLTPQDKISIYYSGSPKLAKILFKNKTLIQKETKTKDLTRLSEKEVTAEEKKLKIDNEELNLAIRKVDKK